jgi:hypothetical protein
MWLNEIHPTYNVVVPKERKCHSEGAPLYAGWTPRLKNQPMRFKKWMLHGVYPALGGVQHDKLDFWDSLMRLFLGVV